ncbi:protein ANTAGONIST OF LIKE HETEROCHROMATIN PROTEIN 1-like [Malus domestica]|uniref:protein ANTAGONIST OF LIKE HETEROCHROMATIN PROTEIN 1-like n=1 Tax=Malus domestica TaxID=3750 RepID=UPI0039769867
MGDRSRHSRAMEMAQYQARLDIKDLELINAEAELVNSFMQYEHHGESSHRGSATGHSFLQRDREECHDQMMKDYFIERPRFPAHDFRRRFRMMRELFEANGCSADLTNEYCQLAESTAIENLKRFCQAIQAIYGATYLRKPTHEDLKRLLRKADKKSFPGMIGSLDCMHWEWKNCPTGWAGQFKGRHNKPTIVLEAVASYDTWIWHAFFGSPGSNNVINVLWSSPLFDEVVNGWAPEFRYKVNGNMYELGYYLTDGIYPSWSTFVKSFSHPDSAKKKLFLQRQESYRKDVERAFGILQARWAIVRGPARFWQPKDLHSIMMTCIILHNMIVEDEYIEFEEDSDEDVDDDQPTHARVIARDVEYLAPTTYETRHDRVTLGEYMRRLNRIQAPQIHDTLRKDLVEHVWRREGER